MQEVEVWSSWSNNRGHWKK